ncbi:MAG TPA: hypothetical protein VGI66_12540 [Streptosporangiaceae bacterium]
MTASLSQDDGRTGVAGSKLVDPRETATAQPAGRQDWHTWARSPVVQALLALAAYTTVWLLTTGGPILRNAGNAHLDQVSMDPNFYTWCLRWWPYALGHGYNPLFTHMVRAPGGNSLAWVTTVPPIALLAAPVTLVAGPIVTFNVLTVIALPLAGWAAFVLCRRLTKRFWPSLAGGAVFGFSAYQMNHVAAGQLNLIYSLLLPILGYLIVRWHEQSIGVRTFVILAGLTMALQFYLFLETFADLTGLLAISLVLGIALAGRAGRPAVLRLGKHLAAAYGIALVLALPYLAYALTSHPPKLNAPRALDLASLVMPRKESVQGYTWLYHLAEKPLQTSAAGYVGIPLLVLALALAVSCWSSKLVRFLTCMLVVVFAASLGSSLDIGGRQVVSLPWSALWNLPIVRNAYPSRLMLFAYLILAVATALFLARPGKLLWLRWPLGLLVIAAIVQDAPSIGAAPHTTVPAFITAGTYRSQVKPGEIVVVVSTIGNAGMLWQADTNFYTRLAGGYINQAITRQTDLPRVVQNLAHATPQKVLTFEAYIKSNKIGAILVDGDHEPQWVGIFRKIGLKGRRIGNVLVYPTNGCSSCRALDSSQIGPPRASQA